MSLANQVEVLVEQMEELYVTLAQAEVEEEHTFDEDALHDAVHDLGIAIESLNALLATDEE